MRWGTIYTKAQHANGILSDSAFLRCHEEVIDWPGPVIHERVQGWPPDSIWRQMASVYSEHFALPPKSPVRHWAIKINHYLQTSFKAKSSDTHCMLEFAFELNWTHLLLTEDSENGLLDSAGVIVQAEVAQHHDGREQEGSGVRLVFPSDIRSRAVHLRNTHK